MFEKVRTWNKKMFQFSMVIKERFCLITAISEENIVWWEILYFDEKQNNQLLEEPQLQTIAYQWQDITKTRLFKDNETFTTKKWKFSDKKILIIFIFLLKT